jgi:hypothetical protein
MRARVTPYTIIGLLALILTILPVALFADLNSPLDKWQNNFWPGRPDSPPHYDMKNLPPPLRAELVLCKALVIPPGFVWRALGVYPGSYYFAFDSSGSSGANFSALPPFTYAYGHFRAALPFWLVVLLSAFELLRLAIRRFRGARRAV